MTGLTSSTNFPTVNPYQDNFAGGSTPDAFGDAFVTKLDPTGSVVYSTYLGGRDNEDASGIAVDASGNSYVTGSSTSTNFPTTEGAFQRAKSGPYDVFVTKLNSQGNGLVYSTYLGGTGPETGFGISVDCSGNAHITGWTYSTDFPTQNAFQPQHGGGPQDDIRDAFMTKMSSDGKSLVYSTYLGGNGVDVGWDITADCTGNAYVTGETWSSNFPTTAGAFQTAFGGGIGDAFVTKLSPAGSVVYSTYVGGSGYEGGIGIAVDFNGNVYVTGSTPSPDFPTTAGSFQTVLRGTNDVFVVKLNPQGNALVYSTYVGGSGFEAGRGIAVDSSGAAYVAGITNSTDFPTRNPIQATNGGGVDTFVMKLNPSGNALVYSTYLGGSGGYEPEAKIGLDSCGNAYVAGITDSTDFPTANPFQAAFGGFNDAFVAKIGTDANTFFQRLAR
ncbi:MAG: SBBP repeat-containing protein [Deltaproteobacteria bacterium]|nr:SBBP repeat-containing protein [Deltaproteobacteria bacterium]